jgi:hypothetical protein
LERESRTLEESTDIEADSATADAEKLVAFDSVMDL